ncbi:MAG: hypothetical protein M1268_03875 [Patescibacteria group bacterium]|nr:hypothetical protein [Patescibacteria group bacterium]
MEKINYIINNIKNRKDLFLSLLIYLTVFFILLNPYADADWGWHYRYGEYLIKNHQILRNDIFSWTMNGYEWVNHSWLYDPILYLLYTYLGFPGLSIVNALIGVLIFYLCTKSFKLVFWQKGILALGFIGLSNIFSQGLRSQILGLLLFSVLISILFSKISWKKILFIPFLFLLWANAHGTFLLGLIFFFVYILGQFFVLLIKEKPTSQDSKNLKFLTITLALSTIITFFNPFTYKVYLEAFKHFSNPWLTYIQEWKPPNFSIDDQGSIAYFIYSFFLFTFLFLGLIKNKKRYFLTNILIAILFLYLSLGAVRYIAFYTVATLPALALILTDFSFFTKKNKIMDYLITISFIVILEIGIFKSFSAIKILNYSYQDYCNNYSYCSEKLAEYLLKNPPIGKGYNIYNWGGFLIGRGVNAKLFIDGRMHLWEDRDYVPFAEDNQIYFKNNFVIFNDYNFDWLIIEKDSWIDKAINSSDKIGFWTLRYSDGISRYYVRNR